MARNGQLIYFGHYRDHPEGSLMLQESNGCLLIANVQPAAATNQAQLNANMEIIVKALNDAGVGKLLKK